jgi:hypothetical protein
MLILTWVGIIFVIILHRAKARCKILTNVMLILTWVGIIFVIILHRAITRCKILTNIMPTHVKISIILHRAIARCKILTNIMPTHVKISIERIKIINIQKKSDETNFLIVINFHSVSVALYIPVNNSRR